MGKDLKGKNLGVGITQRKNGMYIGNYTDRFGKRRYLYSKNLKQIKNMLAEAKAKDKLSLNVVDDFTKLDEWYKVWMEVHKEPYLRASSVRQYEDIYRTKIQGRLGELYIRDINKTQVQRLLNDLAQEGYQWETINKVKLLLNDMYARAIEDDRVHYNPVKGVKNPCGKHRPTNECKALSLDDQKAFFTIAKGTWYYNAFLLAVSTGLRPGELFGLMPSDVNFDKKELHVQRTLLYQKLPGDEKKEYHLDPPKTLTSDRVIPLTDEACKAIIEQMKIRDIIRKKRKTVHPDVLKRKTEFEDLIFTTSIGTPISPQIFNDAIKKLVLEMNLMRDEMDEMEVFTGHQLRHTFATRCFEADIPPKTVQVLLGHATLEMTMNLYTSVLPDKKTTDIERLQEVMKSIVSDE